MRAGVKFPVVVKPVNGAGSSFVRNVQGGASLARTIAEHARAIAASEVARRALAENATAVLDALGVGHLWQDETHLGHGRAPSPVVHASRATEEFAPSYRFCGSATPGCSCWRARCASARCARSIGTSARA